MVDTAEVYQICQFCLCIDSPSNLITSPCRCSHRVHQNCLEDWLNYKKHKKCEDCDYEFDVETKLKYTFIESIRIWLDHPINRNYFITQFVLNVFLNTVATVLIGITYAQIFHLLRDEENLFSRVNWRFGSFSLALLPSMLLFIRCNVIFIETQIIPWYRWWKSRIYYQLKI